MGLATTPRFIIFFSDGTKVQMDITMFGGAERLGRTVLPALRRRPPSDAVRQTVRQTGDFAFW